MENMRSTHARRVVLAFTGVGVALAVASCSSSTTSSTTGACAKAPRGFSQSRLQIADLSDLVCDDPGVTSQALAETNARRIISAINDDAHTGLRAKFVPEITTGWTFAVPAPTAPVTATPALYLPSYPSSSASDTFFFGSTTSRGTNFFALDNLYGASPSLLWQTQLTGSMSGSWVEFDQNHQVYVEDTNGILYCFAPGGSAGAAALCNGWAKQSYTPTGGGNGSQYAAPWWSFDQSAVYFGDGAGILHKVAVGPTNGGKETWEINLNSFLPSTCPGGCSTFQIRSSPIEYAGHIYVGNDAGAFFNITDPGATAPGASQIKGEWLCGAPVGTAGCNSASTTAWSVVNAASIDVSKSVVYAAVNGTIYEYALNPTVWAHQNAATLLAGGGFATYSAPILDRTNGYIYTGYNNELYKVSYPFPGTVTSVALAGSGSDGTYPHGSPLAYSGSVFVGNGAGYVERYGCLAQATAPQLTGRTSSYGTEIDSTPVIDFAQNDINFGFSNGLSAGGAVQLPEAAAGFTCGPGGLACATGCGGASVCVNGGGTCCTAADCGTFPNGSFTCTANNCVEACNGGFKQCGSQCIGSATCCTNADCTSPQVCNGVGGTCVSPTDTITLTLNYPANATITSITGSISAPQTKVTSGTVAVTNGSKTVTGTGTAFTTVFSATGSQQSFSVDGTNWYEVATRGSNTSLTLTTNYLGGTQVGLVTYYESDCNVATQNCNQTYPISLTGLTCSTSPICTTTTNIGLPVGAFSISALGYDSSNRVEASAILPNKLYVEGTGNITTPNLNLIRSFPIGAGANATCPLNMAIDSSGNIWTVNGNGDSGSSCPAPTNNLSKLVKGATPPYAPTVISNANVTASPEWIAADTASGYVWVTVPSLLNGILQLNNDGTTRNTYSPNSDNCLSPRGIDVDPNTTPNAAFVACYGTLGSGDGGRRILKVDSTNTEALGLGLSDSTAQPVSLVYARARAQNSTTIYNTDYHCNHEIYVNRSSATTVVVSAFNLGASDNVLVAPTTNTFLQSSADDNPFGISQDGGGTVYTAARTTGDIRNLEYLGNNDAINSSISQDSDNSADAAPTPWGVAVDDLYSNNFGNCAGVGAISPGNIYTSHVGLNTVSRYNNNPQTKLNEFIVGATSTPGPEGLVFDSSSGLMWVANSLEGSLTQINKNLMLFTTNQWNGVPSPAAGSACVATAVDGTANIAIAGNGFDTTLATNNTVLMAGYMALVTAVNGAGTQLTVTIPNAPSGLSGPVIVANQGGQVESLCTYTTH